MLKCIRCGNRGSIRISSFENLTLALDRQRAFNDFTGLLRRHFSHEVVENVYCGFCSWNDFKSQVRQALGELQRAGAKAAPKQLSRVKSEEKFHLAKAAKKRNAIETLESILAELERLSKYDIKEVDRLGTER